LLLVCGVDNELISHYRFQFRFSKFVARRSD
jgi:hypothetical protein